MHRIRRSPARPTVQSAQADFVSSLRRIHPLGPKPVSLSARHFSRSIPIPHAVFPVRDTGLLTICAIQVSLYLPSGQ
jgi:hypothetical protein